MIALIQRVSSASVCLASDSSKQNKISQGLCVLVGIAQTDTLKDVQKIATKLEKIRIFADEKSKMNLDIKAIQGEILLIPQFTLIADLRQGNRPSFIKAASPQKAQKLYHQLAACLQQAGLKTKTGFFGQFMNVKINNHGPVTVILDSRQL